MAGSELKPAYVVSGDDRPKVEVALERLRGRFDSGAIERFVAAGGGASGADVVAACNAGSLLGDARLVLVTEVDGRRGDWNRLTGGWKAADIDAVAEYLRAPAPGTVLCLVGRGAEGRTRRSARRSRRSATSSSTPSAGTSTHGSRSASARAGSRSGATRATRYARSSATRSCCSTSRSTSSLTWAPGEPLGVDEVRRLATPSREEAPWALTDAWGARDMAPRSR